MGCKGSKSIQRQSNSSFSTNDDSFSNPDGSDTGSSRAKIRYGSDLPLSTLNECVPFTENFIQKEGYKGRRLVLYHCTNEESACLILADKRFIRGQAGYFGGGIYFAESPEAATRKARMKGVMLSSLVEVGISWVVNDNSQGKATFTAVVQKGCDSIKGTALNGNEWIVFNNSQARDIKVVSGMSSFKCDDKLCARYQQYHFGACGKVCANDKCKMYKKKHRAHCKNPRKKIIWKSLNE